MRSSWSLLLLCLSLCHANPRSRREAVEGSGAGGESPDTELTVNEVADLVEKLVGEAIETEIVTVDEASMNEMETNDGEDTEEETVVVKEVVKDDDSVVEPTPEPPHVPIVKDDDSVVEPTPEPPHV